MNEEFRPVVIDRIVVPGYFVNGDLGHVYSAWKIRRDPTNGRILGKYISDELKKLSPEIQKNRDGSVKGMRVNLLFEDGLFGEEYTYSSGFKTDKLQRKKGIHQLVMEAFRPVDEYPPEQLKDDWDKAPESFKQWVRETVVVNHKDHDPSNNSLNNLEYTTPRENSRKAVEFYGGKMQNKGKTNIDEPKETHNPLENLLK